MREQAAEFPAERELHDFGRGRTVAESSRADTHSDFVRGRVAEDHWPAKASSFEAQKYTGVTKLFGMIHRRSIPYVRKSENLCIEGHHIKRCRFLPPAAERRAFTRVFLKPELP